MRFYHIRLVAIVETVKRLFGQFGGSGSQVRGRRGARTPLSGQHDPPAQGEGRVGTYPARRFNVLRSWVGGRFAHEQHEHPNAKRRRIARIKRPSCSGPLQSGVARLSGGDEILGPIREYDYLRETLEEHAARELGDELAVPLARVLLALADDEMPEKADARAWLRLSRNDDRSLAQIYDVEVPP